MAGIPVMSRSAVMRRSNVSSLLYEVEIELHVADLVTAELIEVSALAPEHIPLLPRTQVFSIFEAAPLDVELDCHLIPGADEIFQMERLLYPVEPAVLPRIPESDEFVLALEPALEGMDEDDIRIEVPIEKLALVSRVIELGILRTPLASCSWKRSP